MWANLGANDEDVSEKNVRTRVIVVSGHEGFLFVELES
jgi:hypothetical protein